MHLAVAKPLVLALVFFSLFATQSFCNPLLAAEAPKFSEVQSLLQAKCISCHGPEKQEGNLRLDSFSALQQGGDRGPAVIPHDPKASLLVRSVDGSVADLQMPPKQPLSSAQIQLLADWVAAGAHWPEPPLVLFEDSEKFVTHLQSGQGSARLSSDQPYSGKSSLVITHLQRENPRIPGWHFAIREQPKPGEYRFLRLAWKKRGSGGVMIELSTSGNWPDAKSPRGRYIAGPNTTSWKAKSVADIAPNTWTQITLDLWQDLGDVTLTGIAPTCDQGEEAYFDAILLAPSVASLDSYDPSQLSSIDSSPDHPLGDAWTDKRNPIYRLFRGERLDLWSLRKPNPPPVPSHSHHPIDAFLEEARQKAQLSSSPEADRRTLIRRLSLDLIGLPPSPTEVETFQADTSPDAYEKLVTRLLASRHYGERQARLWLDVIRYADTHGYERDEFRPLAWKFRDYVVRSFNEDKPFDQFVREQLAGDELLLLKNEGKSLSPSTPQDADLLVATGYLRLGQWDSTAAIFQEEDRLRAEQMADLTNTTAAAFLGLTMSCCQCHDHKYDPLSQADHYRLRAFFAGITPQDKLPISLPDEQTEIDQHNAKLDAIISELQAQKKSLPESEKPQHEKLAAEIAQLESDKRQPQFAMAATDTDNSPIATRIFYQGDFSSPREEVSPGYPSILFPNPPAISIASPTSSGRRLTLANWIASTDNPWAARVIVNRIWQQHFGTGLVTTPNDFGYSGDRPSHPELLDWLASEFVRQGWSIKKLHHLIVTSQTYRQDSRSRMPQQKLDPDNRTLWRQNIRRLDAETLRDSLLSVSGLLNPTYSRKPIWPPVAEEFLHAQPAILEAIKGDDGGRLQGWYADSVEATNVRSIYLVRKRALPIPFLQAFDLPDTTVSCARRDTTVVAPQALMLLNSSESIRIAEALAQRITSDLPTLNPEKSIMLAFQLSLQRLPSPQELKLAQDFLARQKTLHTKPNQNADDLALVDLCRALLNLNEFAYID